MNKKLLSASIIAALSSSAVITLPAQGASGLEEIIVTARKRSETVQDTPVAVRAISAQTISQYDITSLEKVADMSPEFSVGRASNGSGAKLTMRGIGSSASSIGIEQSVAVVVDDVYYGQGRIINEGMLDLERVELLKGPQALFFGKNATAGVVALATADPSDEVELIGKLSYEFEAEQSTGEFVVSGPLSDTIKARLALRVSKMQGGLYQNTAQPVAYNTFDLATSTLTPHTAPVGARDVSGEEEFLGRFTLVAEPTDELSLKLKVSGTDSQNDNPSWNYVTYKCASGASSLNPGQPCDEKYTIAQNDYPAEIAQFVPHANSDGSLGNDYSSYQVTGTINYAFENFDLTLVTNFQENKNVFICDCDFQSDIFSSGTYATESSKWQAFSEEVRLLSNFDGSFNFMVGALYQKTDRDFAQYIQFLGLENSAASPENRYNALVKLGATEGETLAPFVQGIWNVTSEVEVTAGFRYTRETKDSTFVQPYVNPALTALWRQDEAAAADQTFEDISPEATINWNVTEDVMLYAAYKTAYKSGGFSISGIYSQFGSLNDFTFDEETAEGFEAGVKSILLDNQLRLNATVYTYEFDDFQVDFFNSPTFAFITLNAGAAETQGIELESEFAPHGVPGLTLRGVLNYNQSEYKDFIAPCWSGQTIAQGCNMIVPDTVGTPGQDVSGEATGTAPEWTAALGFDYEVDLDGGMTLGFSTNLVYSDNYNPSGFANPNAAMDGYTKLDANIRLIGSEDKWELSVIGKNLTDEFIVNSSVDGPSTGSGTGTAAGIPADQIGYGAFPRTWTLQLIIRL